MPVLRGERQPSRACAVRHRARHEQRPCDESADEMQGVQPREQEEEAIGRVARHAIVACDEIAPDPQLPDHEHQREHAGHRPVAARAAQFAALRLPDGRLHHDARRGQHPRVQPQHRERRQRPPVAETHAHYVGDEHQTEQHADDAHQPPDGNLRGPAARRLRDRRASGHGRPRRNGSHDAAPFGLSGEGGVGGTEGDDCPCDGKASRSTMVAGRRGSGARFCATKSSMSPGTLYSYGQR